MNYCFTKMHGAGNDYIYMDGFLGHPVPADPAKAAIVWSQRRFSIGSDGLILILPHDTCDAEMHIFNADGSEAQMCGNGIRCVAKYLYDNDLVRKTSLSIMTGSGVRTVLLTLDGDGTVTGATVSMGQACFEPSSLPLLAESVDNVNLQLSDGSFWQVDCVSVGNPHAVSFVPDVDFIELSRIGPEIEQNPAFPQRVNAEFVQVLSPTHLRFRVWERGSAETLACGTGISAACAVAVRKGICLFDTPITVDAKGGTLSVTVKPDYQLILNGPAAFSYKGEIEYHG